MLKKILYNKYVIGNIDHKKLPINSEEFLKILFDLKDVIMFKYKDELRLLNYSGYNPDWLGRATRFQPFPRASGEVYDVQDLDSCEQYHENVLRGSFSSYSFITDDIDNYIAMLSTLDNAIILNSKQVYLPFIAKTTSANQMNMLKQLIRKVLGKDFESMVVEMKLADKQDGTIIETTNMQVFLQQIQDTKKKVLDEAFLYLGVGRPTGKLAHESELEVAEASEIPDLLDKIMYDKIADFLARCNKKFGLKMTISKKI